MICISALVFRKINQMTAEHGPGLLLTVAGLSLFRAFNHPIFSTGVAPLLALVPREHSTYSGERGNRQRDITPDTLHWSIGRELGYLSPTSIPTRKNRLERYRLVFMGRFRPHTPGLFSARYGLTTSPESEETRSRTDRTSPRTLAG